MVLIKPVPADMTVAELIEKLETVNPYLVVRVWDTQRQCFTDRFHVQSATYDDELLLTPSKDQQPKPPASDLHLFFDDSRANRPSPNL